jgi:hypothetical protein
MSDDAALAGVHARLTRIFEAQVAAAAVATLPLLLLESRIDRTVLNVFDWCCGRCLQSSSALTALG